MSISSRTTYERIENGVDIHLIPTSVIDVVVCNMAFPGGTHATYNKQTVALLVSELLPGSTKKQRRSAIREQFDALGATVSISEGAERLTVRLLSRKATFQKAFTLLVEVLTTPSFLGTELSEAKARLHATLEHIQEDTDTQATIAYSRLLYKKGHPHWMQTPASTQSELTQVTLGDVRTFYADTLSATGALVVIAGDIQPKTVMPFLRSALAPVPTHRPTLVPQVHVNRTNTPKEKDVIVSLRDKINIDTLLAIPLAITRDHEDYYAFATAVHILGGSMTGRLFQSLRTRQSLTYGAYASLVGTQDGYPGLIRARAIFPNDVFKHARTALRTEVALWAKKGVKTTELKKRKEEIAGTHKVGLSTTTGLCNTIFGTLLAGRPISHIDEYPSIIADLTLREVNNTIKNHVDYDLAVTAAAGAVNKSGKPLV